MSVSLPSIIQELQNNRISSSFPFIEEQMNLLCTLNQFAIHQAVHNYDVQKMPAKMIYMVNDELKLALIALLTTCSVLDPKRNVMEEETFFHKQVKIIQTDRHHKKIDFGNINPQLLKQFLIPELVNDWILYRDTCGDGIHALVDYKTSLQGLSAYRPGGNPVYEFARFYRKFMEQKMKERQESQIYFQQMAMKTLTERMIDQQLQSGVSPQQILTQITNGRFLTNETSDLKQLEEKPYHNKKFLLK